MSKFVSLAILAASVAYLAVAPAPGSRLESNEANHVYGASCSKITGSFAACCLPHGQDSDGLAQNLILSGPGTTATKVEVCLCDPHDSYNSTSTGCSGGGPPDPM